MGSFMGSLGHGFMNGIVVSDRLSYFCVKRGQNDHDHDQTNRNDANAQGNLSSRNSSSHCMSESLLGQKISGSFWYHSVNSRHIFIPLRDVWRYPEAPVIILKSLLKSLAVSAEPRLIEATLPDFLQFGPHLFQLCTNLFQALGDCLETRNWIQEMTGNVYTYIYMI